MELPALKNYVFFITSSYILLYDKTVRYALEHSLEASCLAYMEGTMTSGRMLCPHTNWTLAYDWLTQKP